jgi:tripartite-type tricarboxylate transporter receptor subunit TctC
VPTLTELGYPQIEVTDWVGVLVPAKTPADIVNSLNAAIRDALKTDAFKAGLAKQAVEPAGASPSEFAKRGPNRSGIWLHAGGVSRRGSTPI